LDWVEQRYEADHPDTDLRWIQIPPEETLRLLREGAAEEWPDVWWGAPAWLLATAAGEDRLAAAFATRRVVGSACSSTPSSWPSIESR
jgi:hypothetical protein